MSIDGVGGSLNGLNASPFQTNQEIALPGQSNEMALDAASGEIPQMIPYARPCVDQSDIDSVCEVLRSSWLTTGPKVDEYESAFADYCGTEHAVAVSSGTAALHAAMTALDIGPGDEVIVPSITFVATANSVLFRSAKPVFADVEPNSLLIDIEDVNRKVTSKTKAIIAVDYAGQPADWPALRQLSFQYKLPLVADACHSLGAHFGEKKVGQLAELNCFSTHAIKSIATGEGGMITTDDEALASKLRRFRNHGITSTPLEREAQGAWHYEMQELGYNYRLSDVQCALGVSQLKKLDHWIEKRNQIAEVYDQAFEVVDLIEALGKKSDRSHSWHLYVVRLNLSRMHVDRDTFVAALRSQGVGANVHYPPVYLHPYYRDHFGFKPGYCVNAEKAFNEIVSLPMYPELSETQISQVVNAVQNASRQFAK